MVACDDCGGEGGWEIVTGPTSKWGDPTPGGEWVECPTCHGSTWIDSDEPEPEITLDELAEYEDSVTRTQSFTVGLAVVFVLFGAILW